MSPQVLPRLRDELVTRWRERSAAQQPDWPDPGHAESISSVLTRLPGVVTAGEVDALHRLLAGVAAGRSLVLQAGDCAEDPADCAPAPLAARAGLIRELAGGLAAGTGLPVVPVGRIAGQFAKPRSQPTEQVDGRTLPVFRGHLVNGPEPDTGSRTHDPERMLGCHRAAWSAAGLLAADPAADRVWTSHEALVLDYELALVRRGADGSLLLASTHWPWIGERTRQLDAAHVALLAAVRNPVACKVGPAATVDEIRALAGTLDPGRTPGRLTLVARMGAGRVADRLPALARALRAEGHPVIWLCDPMHGNTVRAPDGRKTRSLTAICREIAEFRHVIGEAGAVAGGLHLEVTPEPVTECVREPAEIAAPDGPSPTAVCDPRLNVAQARTVVRAWATPDRRGDR